MWSALQITPRTKFNLCYGNDDSDSNDPKKKVPSYRLNYSKNYRQYYGMHISPTVVLEANKSLTNNSTNWQKKNTKIKTGKYFSKD